MKIRKGIKRINQHKKTAKRCHMHTKGALPSINLGKYSTCLMENNRKVTKTTRKSTKTWGNRNQQYTISKVISTANYLHCSNGTHFSKPQCLLPSPITTKYATQM
jgi:hypothetical protein